MLFRKLIKVKESKNGSLLLMSILILSGIMTSATSVGVITIQSIKQSSLIDNGIIAFYAAESGAEDGLYEIRKKETAVASMSDSGSLSNASTWSRTINTTVTQLTSDILENDFWHIDLYNPDSSKSSLTNSIKSLQLSWTDDGPDAWIEVQVTPWDSTGTMGTPFARLISPASSAIVNLQDATNILYRVRIKPIYSDVTDMTVTAFSGLGAQGGQVNIPAYITLYSTGTFSRANQVVRVQMPHRSPLGGQFGYVLFSEEDLIK